MLLKSERALENCSYVRCSEQLIEVAECSEYRTLTGAVSAYEDISLLKRNVQIPQRPKIPHPQSFEHAIPVSLAAINKWQPATILRQ
jgi:hypothetical protein